ncbi:MAG: vitamin K epoxide reductase family protein [Solirubrobacteraceae bacterium]
MSDSALRRTYEGLCLVGVGIAGYLTVVHYAGLHPVCEISHGCETVQTSRYASLLGIPVALLGLISYLVMILASRVGGERPLLAGNTLGVIAFAFSVYLTYREVFTIHAICTWCVSSAIVFTLLAVVGTWRTLRLDLARTTIAAAST